MEGVRVDIHDTEAIEGYVRQGAHFIYDQAQHENLLLAVDARRKMVAQTKSHKNSISSFFRFIFCQWSKEDFQRHIWYKDQRESRKLGLARARALESRARACERRAFLNRKATKTRALTYENGSDFCTVCLCYSERGDNSH